MLRIYLVGRYGSITNYENETYPNFGKVFYLKPFFFFAYDGLNNFSKVLNQENGLIRLNLNLTLPCPRINPWADILLQ
jgi:hypothetical protein